MLCLRSLTQTMPSHHHISITNVYLASASPGMKVISLLAHNLCWKWREPNRLIMRTWKLFHLLWYVLILGIHPSHCQLALFYQWKVSGEWLFHSPSFLSAFSPFISFFIPTCLSFFCVYFCSLVCFFVYAIFCTVSHLLSYVLIHLLAPLPLFMSLLPTFHPASLPSSFSTFWFSSAFLILFLLGYVISPFHPSYFPSLPSLPSNSLLLLLSFISFLQFHLLCFMNPFSSLPTYQPLNTHTNV